MQNVLAAQIPVLGYVFVSTVLIVVGVALVAFTVEIPLVNIVTSIIGWSLILFGAYTGLIGVFGEEVARTVAGVMFLAIWAIGTIIIILFEAGIIGKVVTG